MYVQVQKQMNHLERVFNSRIPDKACGKVRMIFQENILYHLLHNAVQTTYRNFIFLTCVQSLNWEFNIPN